MSALLTLLSIIYKWPANKAVSCYKHPWVFIKRSRFIIAGYFLKQSALTTINHQLYRAVHQLKK